MDSFSKKIKDIELSLTFDDILIKPAKSNIILSKVSLETFFSNFSLNIPIISAAMDTVTGYEMAREIITYGGIAPLNKNIPVNQNLENLRKLKEEFGPSKPIAISVGVGNSHEEIDSFVEEGANVLLVDSAHGHTENVGNLVKYISDKHPKVFLIAGNVVTKEGAEYLVNLGANAIKVGIGSGSICTTRKVTGIGRGQVNAISEIADFNKSRGILTIADGGIKSEDDIMKSIVCGADLVMLGYMLSGCDECPGEKVKIDNHFYKLYRGMGSIAAMKQGSACRYNKNIKDSKLVGEGIESYVKVKGPVKEVLKKIEWSLRSAFGYIGANNISEVQSKSEIIRVTAATAAKSEIHTVDRVIEED